ncbi:MAG: LysR family transcriptional regulator [Rhodobacterales bacterium]|jgi:LysR family transcriptional regulator, glycine cleavage system transcriptional activator|nr:LysR family transcriptional regulator [Rhodobacterales bacterium]
MAQRLSPSHGSARSRRATRHLSLTHTAEALNLTQAAKSNQVKLLEHALGEPLFERRARALVLTKVAASYLPKVQDGFDRLSAGTENVFGNHRAKMLTVRAPVGFAVNRMASRLPRFFATSPKVPVRIVSSVRSEELDGKRFDLDIRHDRGRWPGDRADQASGERLGPLCAPANAPELRNPGDLANQRLLQVPGFQESWATWLSATMATRVGTGSGAHFDTSFRRSKSVAALPSAGPR